MEQVLNLALQSDTNDYVSGMQSATAAAAGFNKELGKQGTIAGGVSKVLGMVTPGRAMVAGFTAATVAAASYNKQMASLKSTTEVLQKSTGKLDFGRLSKSVKSMSKDYGIAATESKQLIEAFHGIGVRGANAEKQLEKLSRATVKLSKANDQFSPQMAESFGQLSKSFNNLNPTSFEAVGDSLTYVSKTVGANVASVTQFSRAIAPFAKELGMGQKAVMGVSAAFSTLGEDSFVAQNTVSKMFSDIGRSIRDHTPELKVYAEIAGMTTVAFQKMVQTRPEQALITLTENLAKGGQGIRALERIGVEGVRGQRALAAVVQGGTLQEAIAASTSAEAGGATALAAQAQMQDMFTQFSRMSESMKQAGAAFGQPLVKPVAAGAAVGANMASGVASLLNTKPVQTAISAGVIGVGLLSMAKMATKALLPLSLINAGAFKAMFAGSAGAERALTGGAQTGFRARQLAQFQAAQAGPLGPNVGSRAGFWVGSAWRGGVLQAAMGARERAGLGPLPTAGPPMATTIRQGLRNAMQMGSMAAAGYITSTVSDPAHQLRSRRFGGILPAERRSFGLLQAGDETTKRFNLAMRGAMGITQDPATKEWNKTGKANFAQMNAAFKALNGELGKTTGTVAAASKSIQILGRSSLVAGREMLLAGTSGAMGVAGGAIKGMGKGLMGLAGGPAGMAIMGGMAVFGGYKAFTGAQKKEEEALRDPTGKIREYKDLLGETSPELNRFLGSTKGATDQLLEMAKNAGTFKEALALPSSGTFATTAGRAEQTMKFKSETTKGIVSEIMAQSPNATPQDLALMLADVTKQFGRDTATAVAQGLGKFEQFGGTQTATAAGLAGSMYGATAGKTPWYGNLWHAGPAAEAGAGVGSFLLQQYGINAAGQGGPAAEKTLGQEAGKAIQAIVQQPGVKEALQNPGFARGSGAAQTAAATEEIVAAVVGPGYEKIGDAVFNAVRDGNEEVIKIMQRGGSIEEIIQAVENTQNTTGVQGKQINSWQKAFKDAQKAEKKDPFWTEMSKDLKGLGYTNANVAEILHTQPKGSAIAKALEEGGTNVETTTKAAADMLNKMGEQGVKNIDKQMGQLMIAYSKAAEGGAEQKIIQAAMETRSMQIGVQQAGMTPRQRWASVTEQNITAAGMTATTEPEKQMKLQAQQALAGVYQEQVQYYAQRKQMEYEYQKSTARAWDAYYRNRQYMEEDFALQQAYAKEDYNTQVARSERDFQKQRMRAQRDFDKSMRRQIEDFARSALDPFQRYGPKASLTTGNLTQNLAMQNKQMSTQMQQIAQMRQMGLAQASIDTLNLAAPEMYSQVAQLYWGFLNDPDKIAEVNNQILERLNLSGGMVEAQPAWKRQMDDYNTQIDDMVKDHQQGMKDLGNDFDKMTARALTAHKTALTRMLAAQKIAMDQAAKDYRDALRTMDGYWTEIGASMAQKAKTAGNNIYDGLMQGVNRFATDAAKVLADVNFGAGGTGTPTGSAGDYSAPTTSQSGGFGHSYSGGTSGPSMSTASGSGATSKVGSGSVARETSTYTGGVKGTGYGSINTAGQVYSGNARWEDVKRYITTDVGSFPGGSWKFSTKDTTWPAWDGKNVEGALNTRAADNFVKNAFGISTGQNVQGRNYNSDHPKGKAIDIMIPNWSSAKGRAQGMSIASWFVGNPEIFGTKYVIFYDQINSSNGQGWRTYSPPSGVSRNDSSMHRNHVHLSLYKKGGIATKPQLGMVAEAGSPEAMIPLDARGAQFFIKAIGQYMSNNDVKRSMTAGNSAPVTVNVGTTYDHSTHFDGEITVMAEDPDRMAEALKLRARREALTRPRR